MANALPLLLGAAAVFMLMGKKGGGPGGHKYQEADNIYLIEAGDTAQGVEDIAGFPHIYILSSFEGMTSDAIAAHILPVAKANPGITFFVAGVGSPANQVTQWAGFPTAVPNRIVIESVKNAVDGVDLALLTPSAPASLDAMDSALATAIGQVRSMSPGIRGLAASGPTTANAAAPTRMSLRGTSSRAQPTGGILQALGVAMGEPHTTR